MKYTENIVHQVAFTCRII